MTSTRHRPGRNPAAQQSPASQRYAILSVGSTGGFGLKRRDFIMLLGGTALAWPFAARAQQPVGRMRRIGVTMLLAEDDPQQKTWTEAFLQGLQHSGWIDRGNVQIDYRVGCRRFSPRSSLCGRTG